MEAQQRKAYARYRTQGAGGYRRAAKQATDIREMLLLQCIVSGVVLVFALGVSFLPIKLAGELRSAIKLALSQESSAESLAEAVGGITDKYNEMKSSIKTIFGSEPEAVQPPVIETVKGEAVPENSPAPEEAETLDDMGAIIDEGVLQSMNAGNFYEVDESEKK